MRYSAAETLRNVNLAFFKDMQHSLLCPFGNEQIVLVPQPVKRTYVSHVSVFEPGIGWSRISIDQADQLSILAFFSADVTWFNDKSGVVCKTQR